MHELELKLKMKGTIWRQKSMLHPADLGVGFSILVINKGNQCLKIASSIIYYVCPS